MVLAAVIVLASLLLAAWAVIRGAAARRTADRIRSLTATAPGAYLTVDRDGGIHCSEKLSDWLGVVETTGNLNVLSAENSVRGLTKADFKGFSEAVSRLTREGRPFTMKIRPAGGDRVLEVTGVANDDCSPALCAVWFSDITDRESATRELGHQHSTLLRAHDKLAGILDAAPLPMWRRGKDTNIDWVNDAYVKAVDGESRESVLRNRTELTSRTVTPAPQEVAGDALADGSPRISKHFVVIGGMRRAVTITDVPLPDGDGITGIAVDTTDLEDARVELARHIEAHAETLNKLSAAIAIYGANKCLEFFNSTFARLWRLPEDWLATKPHHSELLELMHEGRRLPEQANFPEWKRGRLSLYTELIAPQEELWHLPDGSTLRVIAQPHPFGGLLMIYEDVTDRLALESSYNTLTAVQRESLNNLYEGIAVFGGDGILKLHNPAFAKIWELDRSFLDDSPHIRDVVDRCRNLFDNKAEWDKLTATVLDHTAERASGGGRMHRPDGTVIDYMAVPLPDGATLFTYLDVSDEIRIERALRERNDALETSDRLKSEFIAHVSYELRTPLNTILGFSEILDKEYFGPLNDRQHEYVAGTLESSGQLLTLINDILDLATIEAGAMDLEPAEFDVDDALATVLAIAREQAEKSRISIVLDCPSRLGAIEADERRIKQILFNLLSNAIKFTPPEGQISLGARRDGESFQFYVSDTGIGMDPEEQSEAFEKFFTGSPSPHRRGAGLGLSLVRSFVELHGGRVELESRPGEGTRVTCTLPARVLLDKGTKAAFGDIGQRKTVATVH